MKRLLCIVFTLFALAFATQAQLLWQISGNSTKHKSYLFATEQLTDILFLDSIPNIFKVYNKCSNIITEMKYSDEELQQALINNAVLPDSLTLEKIYQPNDYKLIKEATQLYLDIPLKEIDRIKPVYLNELIRQSLLIKWAGYNPERSIDNFFQSIAEQSQKTLIGLDNTGEVIYMLFEREPIEWQKKELIRTLTHPENEIKQTKTIAKFYQDGQLNEISYQIAMPDNQTSISYSDYKIYCARNKEWVKKLAPYLKEGSQFIVLNCMYLGGDNGLIAQLRKAGYKVKPYNKRLK